MKTPIVGKDQIVDTYYPTIMDLDEEIAFQEYEDIVLKTNNILISTLAMDFPPNTSPHKRKEIDEQWKNNLPNLKHIKRLDLRHLVDQDYFDAICEMEGLEVLNIWTSIVTNINSIKEIKSIISK